ncbi:MAG: DUF3037 domain-containing protein [Phycisphaerae bacterium]|nr:DUF3037 domain-containing protein [Phycisphaerae bacterium]
MSAMKAYYSVIQYCPNRSRLEAANIGVLLLCPEAQFVRARTAANNARVRRFFNKDSFDLDTKRINATKKAIERRLATDNQSFRTPEDLVRFIDTRANEIVLTPPRPMKVSNPEADLDHLFDELVGGPARQPRKGAAEVVPELDRIFHRPSLRNRVLFDQEVQVPVVERSLRIPYAFRNGVLNLVKPQAFSNDVNAATRAAMSLAITGDLLRRHPNEQGKEARLVVVPAITPAACDVVERVRAVLSEYCVRTVLPEDITEFGEEIERTAHA